jgi:hypothetical protein
VILFPEQIASENPKLIHMSGNNSEDEARIRTLETEYLANVSILLTHQENLVRALRPLVEGAFRDLSKGLFSIILPNHSE